MQCMVCFTKLPDGEEVCPCCGFIHYSVIGDEKGANEMMQKMAKSHRNTFLRSYDLGVTVYSWKDQNGSVVLDKTDRRSFGTADTMVNKTVWLDQEFARIPEKTMNVELSVKGKNGTKTIPVQVQVPQERQLQKLGIRVNDDLTVSLLLANRDTQTQSGKVAFLKG